ncbi:MAG TPA: hypothetical protein VFZ64_03520 [Nocardioidaceae bacterium]
MSGTRKELAAEAERRRRIAAIFGDPLPDRTRDECAETRGDDRPAAGPGNDDWLRSQVPPHHG